MANRLSWWRGLPRLCDQQLAVKRRSVRWSAGVLALCVACSTHTRQIRFESEAPQTFQVPLEVSLDRTPEKWRGLSNIFFDSVSKVLRDSVRSDASWRDISLAAVVDNPRLHQVSALRVVTPAHDTSYYVDTLGNLDFRIAQKLEFERRGSVRVANIDLTVRSLSGSQRRVPYQVLLSDDGYSYARIAEYRSGSFVIDGHSFKMIVRNRRRGEPFFAVDAGTVFMVDLNGDGQIAEQNQLSIDGRPVATEQVMPQTPFVLAGRAFEVAGIDSSGSLLRITTSSRRTAVAPGLRAPDLRVPLLADGEWRLANRRAKVTLVEFWATNCGYSEEVRGALNELAKAGGSSLEWLAVARERDGSQVRRYLSEHPMLATVALADSTAWETFNPVGATPTFIIIDERGIVRLVASGASAAKSVSAVVAELIPSLRRSAQR